MRLRLFGAAAGLELLIRSSCESHRREET